MRTQRRAFLGALGAVLGSGWLEGRAHAALARGLTLAELVQHSGQALVGTPLASHCEWTTLGGRRLIVTDTRIRVEEHLSGAPAEDSELIVRVLGGIVGDVGERVSGQAELTLGKACALFLTPVAPALAYVTGAAQGHYPLREDEHGSLRLHASPHLPELLQSEGSAVRALTGASLTQARELVRAVAR